MLRRYPVVNEVIISFFCLLFSASIGSFLAGLVFFYFIFDPSYTLHEKNFLVPAFLMIPFGLVFASPVLLFIVLPYCVYTKLRGYKNNYLWASPLYLVGLIGFIALKFIESVRQEFDAIAIIFLVASIFTSTIMWLLFIKVRS